MGVDHLIVLSKLLFWIPFIIMTSAFFYLFKRPNKYLLLSACPMIYFIHKIRGFYYYDSGISLFCYEIGLLASAIFFIFVLEYFRKKINFQSVLAGSFLFGADLFS
ncbi:hypothetical protein ACX126_09715 [Enterococcus faecium]|uniref:hypothetical protein n=1 Tax=Enterococcus faecium TaxID=1352 RepID=UPI001156D861|nr:hypothetical protein [Enterococcus faecium]MBE8865927.1 hypothetical protein [Enterococcus faecium]